MSGVGTLYAIAHYRAPLFELELTCYTSSLCKDNASPLRWTTHRRETRSSYKPVLIGEVYLTIVLTTIDHRVCYYKKQ